MPQIRGRTDHPPALRRLRLNYTQASAQPLYINDVSSRTKIRIKLHFNFFFSFSTFYNYRQSYPFFLLMYYLDFHIYRQILSHFSFLLSSLMLY